MVSQRGTIEGVILVRLDCNPLPARRYARLIAGRAEQMCGRYSLVTFYQDLAEEFELAEAAMLPQRFNIAPTQVVPVIRLCDSSDGFQRQLSNLRWGLIPHWAKDPSIGSKMINARSEEAATKPSFRVPLRRQRCLVPSTGFFEWQKVEGKTPRGFKKQPFYIRRRDEKLIAFGGLWDRWRDGDGSTIESFSILTTSPNELIRPLHDRMPVILQRSDYELWLDPKMQDPAKLNPLFSPFPESEMTAHPVSTRVNNTRFDDAACIQVAV